MAYANYTRANPRQSTNEVLVTYHVLQAKEGREDGTDGPGREIMAACMEGPLPGALAQIGQWSRVWAPLVLRGESLERKPEIALFAEETSRGNLQVTWVPMMTREEYEQSPREFKNWLERVGQRPIAQRSLSELFFIREFSRIRRKSSRTSWRPGDKPLTDAAIVGLASLLAELPEKLRPMVNAHWQHVMVFGFETEHAFSPDKTTPEAGDIVIYEVWDYHKNNSAAYLASKLAPLKVTEQDLLQAVDDVSVTNPRVVTPEGRHKVIAKRLQVEQRDVRDALEAIRDDQQWRGEQPDLWWNRKDPYPPYWGGRWS